MNKQQITPELVRRVTEKVFTMWLRDIRLERERRGGMENRVNHYGQKR